MFGRNSVAARGAGALQVRERQAPGAPLRMFQRHLGVHAAVRAHQRYPAVLRPKGDRSLTTRGDTRFRLHAA